MGAAGISRAGLLLVSPWMLVACSTLNDAANVPRAGYQTNGTYVLSADEQRYDCRHLKERSEGLLDQLKALPARALEELKEAPTTVALFMGRMMGDSKSGVAAVAEFDQGRAEAAALNNAMAKKGCATLNLDTELGPASAEIATVNVGPKPQEPQAKPPQAAAH